MRCAYPPYKNSPACEGGVSPRLRKSYVYEKAAYPSSAASKNTSVGWISAVHPPLRRGNRRMRFAYPPYQWCFCGKNDSGL